MLSRLKAAVEVPRAKFISSAFPIKLTIALTYRCQSRCKHCSIWKLYDQNPERCKDEAHLSLYLKLLEDLRSNILWLEFTGGEAFLRTDIAEIVGFALERTGIFAAGITSNGLNHGLILERVLQILAKSRGKQLVIGISLDGDPDTYRQVRGLDGFDSAMSTFLHLRQLASSFSNLRPHIAYTINRFNVGEFQNFYSLLSEKYGIGISEISFAIEHPFGYYFQDQMPIVKNTLERFGKRALNDLQVILHLKHDHRFDRLNATSLFYDYYLKSIPTYLKDPSHQIIPCTAGKNSAFIDPYGNVYPCTMMNTVIGSLKKDDFRTVWESEKRCLAMQNVKLGKCPSCWTPCEAQPSWLLNLGFVKGWW